MYSRPFYHWTLKHSFLVCHQPLQRVILNKKQPYETWLSFFWRCWVSFSSYYTRVFFMKILWRATCLVLETVLPSTCSAFILWNLNFVMAVFHFLHWPLENLKPIKGLKHSIWISIIQIHHNTLAPLFPLLYIFIFLKVL